MTLAIENVIATSLQLALLILFIYKKGYKHKFVLNIKDEHIKNMAYIAFLIIMRVSVNQINTLVDRTLVSSIAIDGISVLSYANKLNGFVQELFVVSLAIAM